ncbi:sialidase family protein [uncultured Microbacterium sp.]|uniref:sialidase family protein n=1 Tax=uncultured Microbacterium sp. TaxID=191216 RepID=UPI0035C96199
MADYWAGNAEWVYQRRDSQTSTGTPGYFEGSSVRVSAGGTWYLFSRSKTAVFCSLGIVVRSSTDQGASWSAPTQVVNHTAGTPYSCMATDGAPYYNSAANKWVLMFQCYDGTSWKGCYAERSGASPMGAFTPAATAKVTSGQLWDQICNQPTDDCVSIPGAAGVVGDEGTWDIFDFDGTYYWVAFHGFDGTNGYRGIAKTTNFTTWIAGDPAQGVPTDAFFDRNDSQSWRESWSSGQSIGGGHGSIYKEGSQYYQLIEGADLTLNCVNNQNWDFGLYRSTSLSATSWTPIPAGNPVLYSGRAANEPGGNIMPCNLQYTSLFKDPTTGFIWMTYGRSSTAEPTTDALYWFRLEKTGNLLKNSDLWRANTDSYARTGTGTNWAVNRLPANSVDGTPYLSVNCGGTCGATNSVYQDVPFTPSGQTTVSASVKALKESGTGNIAFTVFQLNSSGGVIKSDSYTINATSAWSTYPLTGTLNSGTKTLRFQMYLNGNATFRVDDLSLRVS